MSQGQARFPLTAGELWQGYTRGRLCLVSAPIDRYVTATVRLTGQRGPVLGGPPKARRAADLVRRQLGEPEAGLQIRLEDPYPVGKGLGTSTADIAAVAQATARVLGGELSPTELGRLAAQLDPTDGSLLPGLALWDHRRGELLEAYGDPPPLGVWLFDFGGVLSSATFNHQRDLEVRWAAEEERLARALRLLRRGLVGEPRLLGGATTRSLLASLPVRPQPGWLAALRAARRAGALGVVRAHSGTLWGLLYADKPPVQPPIFPARPLFAARLRGGGEA